MSPEVEKAVVTIGVFLIGFATITVIKIWVIPFLDRLF